MALETAVILAAGGGDGEGAHAPPLLGERRGTLLIEELFQQIDFAENIVIVLQQWQAKQQNIDSIVSVLRPDAQVVLAPGPTAGAACSALLAVDQIDLGRELLLLNANEFVDIDSAEVIETFRQRDLDVGTIIFSSLHPRYCYARLDSEGLIEEVSEKRPISRNAVAGFFWWRQASDFVGCASHVIRTQNDVNGQFYICPTLNEMIMLGKQVGVFKIEAAAYHPLKTVAQSRDFEHGAVV